MKRVSEKEFRYLGISPISRCLRNILLLAVLVVGSASATFAQTLQPDVKSDCQSVPAVDAFSWVEIRAAVQMLKQIQLLPEDLGQKSTVGAETCAAISSFAVANSLDPASMRGEELITLLAKQIDQTNGWKMQAGDDIEGIQAIKAAQRALLRLGYPLGKADGQIGAKTRAAVALFQKDAGLRISTRLTRNVYDNIIRAARFGPEPPAGIVRVLNWPDYIDNDELLKFERDTRFRVVYDVTESQTETLGYLANENSRFDVVVFDLKYLKSSIEKRLLSQLDLAKIPNHKLVGDRARNEIQGQEGGEQRYALPYLFGVIGIGVDEQRVKKIIPNVNTKSLGLLFDPAITSRLIAGGCKLGVIDEAGNVMVALAAYAKRRAVGPVDVSMIDDLRNRLRQLAPNLHVVGAGQIIDKLSTGEFCAALMFSGDALLASAAAKKQRRFVTFNIPQVEGAQMGADILVVPRDSPNKEAAFSLINFLLKPEVAAANTNKFKYANAVPSSNVHLDPVVAAQLKAALNGEFRLVTSPDSAMSDQIDKLWETAPLKREAE